MKGFELIIDYESIPVAICIIDRSLNLISANQKYADIIRAPLNELIGKSISLFNKKDFINNFKSFDYGGVVPAYEIEVLGNSYLVCVQPIQDAVSSFTVAISVTMTNINHQKQREKELSNIIGELISDKKKITHLSETDALTGLGNRRAFEAALAREIKNARQMQKPLSLLVIDVDIFKMYNDLYGHLKGDECLCQVAGLIQKNIKYPDDLVVRFGGEEFAVLLPNQWPEEAEIVAEAIRFGIFNQGITHLSSPLRVVTVSVGVSSYSAGDHDDANDREIFRSLFAAADSALYEAKSAGRNKVVMKIN